MKDDTISPKLKRRNPEQDSRRRFIKRTAQGAVGAGIALTADNWQRVLGANDRIRLGVIGTGNRGQDVSNAFMKQEGLEIVALSDAYDLYLNQLQEKVGGKARAFPDYRGMLDDKAVDAVFIATPDHWHTQMAIDACKAGKDIYIEKPLTFTIEEGHRIINAVKESKRVMQVGLQQRSGEHYIEAKREYFDSGKIGKITLVRTWWHGNSYHLRRPNFKDKPDGLDWRRFLGPATYREFDAHQFYNWRAYLDFGGGQITDLFTHWIDVVHWYVNEDVPVTANAVGGVYHYKDGRTAPDTIAIQLEYPSSWAATFEATLAPGARGAAIEFMGTGGRLYIDRGGYVWQEMTPRRAAPTPPVERKTSEDLNAAHVKNFLDCVRSRKLPNSDVVSAHRSALASHLGKIAYIEKKRINYDPNIEKAYSWA
ncbi:MAG: Gfo/Idh/MocA family oxidoreductase [Acidobacteria bacterium]|nr:Gfo/Idh/MocA family oxidoreductase [Acidobacteriota bacterium]